MAPLGFGAEGDGAMFQGHINRKLDEFFAPEFLNRLDEVVVFAVPREPKTPKRVD